MSSTNMKEADLLKKWAGDHKNRNIFDEYYLRHIDKDSYFIDKGTDENYIMEYDFHSVNELVKMFEEYGGSDKDASIRKIAAVTAFKLKSINSLSENVTQGMESDKRDSKIPEHIYVF